MAELSLYDLEFRSTDDDAWYSVRTVLEGEVLTVKYLTFPQCADLRFAAGDFSSSQAVEEFRCRFRQLSEQLQDSNCSRVKEGMTVCAAYSFKEDDIRYFDANVEVVHHETHSIVNGEEECLCFFVISWLHGPNLGNVTSTSIANMCVIESTPQVDSRVASFTELTKEKLGTNPCKFSSVSESGISSTEALAYDKGTCGNKENCGLYVKSQSQIGSQEMKSARQFSSAALTAEAWRTGKYHQENRQDEDMGGESFCFNSSVETKDHHFILIIDNLEKDLSPLSVNQFIYRLTSISPQVYVFPSLSLESYTRGAIVLDCEQKAREIFEFLENPARIIISSRGRPWVVVDKRLRHGKFRTTSGSLMANYEHKCESKDSELKVVHSGSEQFLKAKRRKKLFMDFKEHQERLHKRLTLEETNLS